MKLPSASQLIALHDELLVRHGGEPGYHDATNGAGSVESAIHTTATAVGLERLTVFEAAALLGAYLLTSHPFLDGNKRAASSATLVTLELNRVELRADPREIFEKFLELQRATERSWEELGRSLAPREIVADLAPWLARRSVPG